MGRKVIKEKSKLVVSKNISDDLVLDVYNVDTFNARSKYYCMGCDKDSDTETIYVYELKKKIPLDKDNIKFLFKDFERLSFTTFCRECGNKVYNVDLDANKIKLEKCEVCGKASRKLYNVEFGNSKIRYCKKCSHTVFGGKDFIDENIFGTLPICKEEDRR